MKSLLPLGLMVALTACATPLPSATSAPSASSTGSADGIVRPQGDGPVVLKVGQVVEIALMANASTGYQWQVVSDGAPALVATTGPATPPPMDTQPPMPGAPALARWWFRAQAPGAATLKLEYRRPWEHGVPPAQVAEYRVEVGP